MISANYRTLVFNKRDEILSIKDFSSFEDSLKSLILEINEYSFLLSGAFIYKYLDPEHNQSMQMVASLRVIRF